MDASSFSIRSLRRLPSVSVLLATLALAACQTPDLGDITSTVGMREPPSPTNEPALRAYVATTEPRYVAHPDNKAIAINYATALRGLTQHAQAVAVLQRLAVKYPRDMDVLAAYGKSLADAGRLQEASEVLEHSHLPEHPSWSVLSAQGSVADQMGDHAQAQRYYAAALKIVPHQPQVLSNLGLSYALEHHMRDAETTLREAVAQPGADMRVRQNLALILSLESKTAEAEAVARRDLSAIDAAETVASMRHGFAQSETWQAPVTKTRPDHPAKVAHQTAPVRTQTASSDTN